jgi:hypothetical protein
MNKFKKIASASLALAHARASDTVTGTTYSHRVE